MIRVNTENFAEQVLQTDKAVLVEFYSDSCVPCKRLSPILAEIEESEAVNVAKVNINFDLELAEKYEVQLTPTLILFRAGNEVGRLQSAVKKAQILELINK